MLFKTIYGQEKTIQRLISSAQSGRIGQALLFLGPEGCGNLALAIAYARYVNCLNPGPDDACGSCSSCLKMDKLILADVHFTFPIVGGDKICDEFYAPFRKQVLENPFMGLREWLLSLDSENKQGNIPARECQEIIRKLSLTHLEATYKIQIIWMAEFLGKEGNKLLKIIEEPPTNTLFFLIAQDTEKILPTILSRCQTIRIPPPDTQGMVSYFMQEFPEQSPEKLENMIRLSGNNYLKAGELLAHEDTGIADLAVQYFQLSKSLQTKTKELFGLLDQIAALSRERIKLLLHFLLQELEQEARMVYMQNQSTPNAFRGVADLTSFEKMNEWLNKAAASIEWNGNPKLVLYDLSLSIQLLTSRWQTKN